MKLLFRLLVISFILNACTGQPTLKRSWDMHDGYEGFWALLESETAELKYLMAEVEIKWKLNDRVDRASALLQVAGTDSIGIEIRGPFYTRLLSILVQADSLIVSGKSVGKPLKGAINGPLLSNITGLHLGNHHLSSLLLGQVFLDNRKLISEEYLRADRASLIYENDVSRQIIILDLLSGVILAERFERPIGEVLFERKMGNYIRVDNLFLPRNVKIKQDKVVIDLNFKSFETNKILSFDRFDPGIPEAEISRVLLP